MDEKLSEILGFLCAEGSHNLSFRPYYEHGKRLIQNKRQERICVYNKDTAMIYRIRTLLEDVFSYSFRVTKDNRINIANRKIMYTLLNQTDFGVLKWKVPDKILTSQNYSIKVGFIRGYFDGDGTARGAIRFFSVNRNSLLQVSKILTELGFKHTFLGPYYKPRKLPSYVIQVSRTQKKMFLKIIGPHSKRPKH